MPIAGPTAGLRTEAEPTRACERQRCARYSLQKNLCISQDWALQAYHDAEYRLQTQFNAFASQRNSVISSSQ